MTDNFKMGFTLGVLMGAIIMGVGVLLLMPTNPCPPCPEAVTRVFCFEVEGRQREVPYDDMIMRIVEDVKICAELEPESKWLRLHDSYMANLDIISSEATHADTVCFKTTDCTEEP